MNCTQVYLFVGRYFADCKFARRVRRHFAASHCMHQVLVHSSLPFGDQLQQARLWIFALNAFCYYHKIATACRCRSLRSCIQVLALKNQLCQAMSAHMDHDNACVIFTAADAFDCPELKGQAFSRIVMDFALATSSEGWISLPQDLLAQVSPASSSSPTLCVFFALFYSLRPLRVAG